MEKGLNNIKYILFLSKSRDGNFKNFHLYYIQVLKSLIMLLLFFNCQNGLFLDKVFYSNIALTIILLLFKLLQVISVNCFVFLS